MRTFDLAPLYRSTVGFDRLFSMLDQVSGFDNSGSTYPPYNIERTGETAYRITLAVAGFAENVEVKGAALENGLLHVALVRQVQEAMKPRRIAIGTGGPKVIDAKAA